MLSIKKNWDAVVAAHSEYVIGKIKGALEVQADQPGYISSMALRKFVRRRGPDLATGSVGQLKNIIEEVRTIGVRIRDEESKWDFVEGARLIFDYDQFSSKEKSGWSAYKLCQQSRYSVCPYCNQAYAFTVMRGKKGFRPTLDHFFPKHKYPFLALSLYNLIPSCYICNSNLKGKIDFYEEEHLHPFACNREIKFQLETAVGHELIDLLGNDSLQSFMEKAKLAVVSQDTLAEKNSVKTFLLEHRFSGNMSVIHRFVRARRRYGAGRINDIKNVLGKSVDENLVLQFDKQNYKDEMLGKIFLDLYAQFEPL